MTRFLLLFLLMLGLVIIQVSFLSSWPLPVKALNLVLTLVIFFALTMPYSRALALTFSSGLLLEFYSINFFGLVSLSLVLTVILVHFLFEHFFTNRSLYAFIGLVLIGTLSYNLIFYAGNFLVHFFQPREWAHIFYPVYFFWQLALNSLIFVILFFVFQLTNRRLASHTTFFK